MQLVAARPRGARAPGPAMYIRQMLMNFSYSDAFGEFPATAYETLLLDAIQGDLTLFNRRDAVDLSWQILEPVKGRGDRGPIRYHNRPALAGRPRHLGLGRAREVQPQGPAAFPAIRWG